MSPQVQFIKLKKPEKARYLCELAGDHFERGHKVLILVQDDNQAVTLDRFMWVWRKEAFIPHCFANGAVDCGDEAVVITTEEHNVNGAQVLIMGRPCSLGFIRQFRQIIDFVESYDEQLLQASRRRFISYRDAGFAPSMYPS